MTWCGFPLPALHGIEQTHIPLVILNEVKNLFFYEVSFAHRNFTVSRLFYEKHLLGYNKAIFALVTYNALQEAMEEANDAKKHMDIWGPPTYYSSSYSDSQYRKYKEIYNEKMATLDISYKILKECSAQLKDTLSVIDTTKVVGWEVLHRFRCKTKGGHSAIADYRYVFDKNLKNILISEDMDDEYSKTLRALMTSIQNGSLD